MSFYRFLAGMASKYAIPAFKSVHNAYKHSTGNFNAKKGSIRLK